MRFAHVHDFENFELKILKTGLVQNLQSCFSQQKVCMMNRALIFNASLNSLPCFYAPNMSVMVSNADPLCSPSVKLEGYLAFINKWLENMLTKYKLEKIITPNFSHGR